MKTTQFRCFMFELLSLGLLTGGCSSMANMMGRTRTINVMAIDSICKKSVEVHLVGLNRFEKERWEKESMTDYWKPGNDLREGATEFTYVIKFGKGQCKQTLGKKDRIRRIWKERKAEYLFVLADLPSVYADSDSVGNADIRRLCLPAPNSKCWSWSDSKIDIRVEDRNMISLTTPKSKCD